MLLKILTPVKTALRVPVKGDGIEVEELTGPARTAAGFTRHHLGPRSLIILVLFYVIGKRCVTAHLVPLLVDFPGTPMLFEQTTRSPG